MCSRISLRLDTQYSPPTFLPPSSRSWFVVLSVSRLFSVGRHDVIWHMSSYSQGFSIVIDGPFWHSLDQVSEKSKKRVCNTHMTCCRKWQKKQPSTATKYSNQVQQASQQFGEDVGATLPASGSVERSGLNSLVLRPCQAHPQQNMQGTYHQPGWAIGPYTKEVQKRLGTGARFSPYTDAGASRQGLGGVEGVGEVPVINLTGSQVANRCQKIKRWSKSQGQNTAKRQRMRVKTSGMYRRLRAPPN